jgi:hypothetical protein
LLNCDGMDSLLSNLDKFIRKYHFTLLVKNIIFFFLFLIAVVLLFSLIEYSLWLNSTPRKVLFFGLLILTFCLGLWFFFLPFMKISKYYKKINRFDAADIIGYYFPEIRDKFRNLLELRKIEHVSRENIALLNAAIQQKSEKLTGFKFSSAIEKSRLKRAAILFLPVLTGFIFLAFTMPETIKNPLDRIVHYNTKYEKPAPFEFVLESEILSGIQGDNAIIELAFRGEAIPDGSNIIINGNAYPMQRLSTSKYQYTIKQLKTDFVFHFEANGFVSREYHFDVIVKPSIVSFIASLTYPAYTGRVNETKKNSTDFQVPQGTKINWTIQAKDVSKIIATSFEKEYLLSQMPGGASVYRFQKQFGHPENLIFTAFSDQVVVKDSILMFIDVIPDQYPNIIIEELRDSLYINRIFFTGNINDDYGFTELNFYYKPEGKEDFIKSGIPFTQQIIDQQFYFMFDFSAIDQWREIPIDYYFSITDNDAVNGRKTTKSHIRTFVMPDSEEMEKVYEEKHTDIEETISNAITEAKEIQKEIEALRFEMMNTKNLSWEQKNRLDQLVQRQQELEQEMEMLRNETTEKNIFEEQMKEIDPTLLEKQRQLEEMFDKLFSEEMKEMMRKMQEMINEMNKDKILEEMEKMQLRSEDIEKNLENNLELMKQLEFEKKMDEMLNELEELKQDLEELNEDTENQTLEQEKLEKEQETINSEFEEIKERIQELDSLNNNLFDPMEFPDIEQLMEDISEDLEDASENISKGKNSQAGKSQKGGAQKMDQLSQMMQSAMESHQQETLAEDIENLKMILKNLINISFAQENNINLGLGLGPRDPRYINVLSNQKKLIQRFKIVEDSLVALGKRQMIIQPLISQDIGLIRQHSRKIDEYLTIGALAAAMTNQQYLMHSVNNLALLLIEALEQMNSMMQQQSSGNCSGSCKSQGQKPGNKPSPKSMKQLQEQLNQQMEQLMKQMQEGKQGENGQYISEQLAKMAAQQEAIRRQLQEYGEMLKSMGIQYDAKILNELMQQMEQTERDLVNKQLNQSTMNRQNDILIRLMESEKAELEREKDENRTSRTGKVINNSNPEEFFQYKRNITTSDEIIKSIPPMFNSFYRQKVNKFYLELIHL